MRVTSAQRVSARRRDLLSIDIKKEVCELGKYSIQPVNGVYTVPDRPGIGQELSDKAMAEAVNVYTFK